MSTQADVLKRIPDTLIVDLTHSIQAKGKYATGRTIQQLESAATDDSAQLLAPWHIGTLEFGRKPTRPDAPKGDPTLQEVIAEWCVSKGIDPKAAYPIAQKIHKFGFSGTPGVLTEPLGDANVDKRVTEVCGPLASLLTHQLGDMLHI